MNIMVFHVAVAEIECFELHGVRGVLVDFFLIKSQLSLITLTFPTLGAPDVVPKY